MIETETESVYSECIWLKICAEQRGEHEWNDKNCRNLIVSKQQYFGELHTVRECIVWKSECVCKMTTNIQVQSAAISVDSGGCSKNNHTETKHQHVVKKSTEPGVINDAMLKNVLHAYGPHGEAARLCLNIAIDYSTITELCLEYQNILKIDHIWMCFNLQKLTLKANKLTKIENLDNLIELRELDLSFNFIKTIENLDCLRKLEYITLYQNDIRKIENLGQLEHLVRLNLGNNFIETVDGVIRKFTFYCFFSSFPLSVDSQCTIFVSH